MPLEISISQTPETIAFARLMSQEILLPSPAQGLQVLSETVVPLSAHKSTIRRPLPSTVLGIFSSQTATIMLFVKSISQGLFRRLPELSGRVIIPETVLPRTRPSF